MFYKYKRQELDKKKIPSSLTSLIFETRLSIEISLWNSVFANYGGLLLVGGLKGKLSR